MSNAADRIKDIWQGQLYLHRSLAEYSTLRIGGPAEVLAVPESIDEIVSLLKVLAEEGIPWKLIGRGSNILFPDSGITGVVIVLGSQFADIEYGKSIVDSHAVAATSKCVSVQAGCSIAKLLNWCVQEGLGGLEFLAGIPGSIGGAAVMNAGAMGHEISEVMQAATMVNRQGETHTRIVMDNEFVYRQWHGAKGSIVAEVLLKLEKEDGKVVKQRCLQNIAKRKLSQPKGASAGSFFKNPSGDYAGRLIECVGLKGKAVGGARVSPVHANFIMNTGGATAEDVLTLMSLIQENVYKVAGVWLQPEVKIL